MTTSPKDDLTLAERGLYAVLEEIDPASWSYSVSDLERRLPDGYRRINNCSKALIDKGYLRTWHTRLIRGEGMWVDWKLYPEGDAPPQD